MSDMMWVWVAIAAVVLVAIIVIAVIVGRRKGREHNRERAAELRSRAAEDDQLISTREDRAGQLEVEAEAARQKALHEYERAESLRTQAEESDELAARATDEARVLADEAEQSRESYEAAVAEHDETLREADRRDPDVHTDRHGNRIEDSEPAEEDVEDDEVVVVAADERLDNGDDYSGEEFAEPDTEYIDPVDHDRLDHDRVDLKYGVAERDDETSATHESDSTHEAEANRLDELNEAATPESNGATAVADGAGDDPYRGDDAATTDARSDELPTTHIEPMADSTSDWADSNKHEDASSELHDETGDTSDPDVEYIDPADHDRLAESDEALLLDSGTASEDTFDSSPVPAATEDSVDQQPNDSVEEPDSFVAAERPLDDGPALDPYGNPVILGEAASSSEARPARAHDSVRDEPGPLLDPYGNPIIDNTDASEPSPGRHFETVPQDDPYVTDDADDDVPRDEQGRRLDPYGNPVPENLQ